MSLDRLHLRAGDEIEVPQRRDISWFAVVSAGLSVTVLVLAIFRRY
jgi:hypothetical protein